MNLPILALLSIRTYLVRRTGPSGGSEHTVMIGRQSPLILQEEPRDSSALAFMNLPILAVLTKPFTKSLSTLQAAQTSIRPVAGCATPIRVNDALLDLERLSLQQREWADGGYTDNLAPQAPLPLNATLSSECH